MVKEPENKVKNKWILNRREEAKKEMELKDEFRRINSDEQLKKERIKKERSGEEERKS